MNKSEIRRQKITANKQINKRQILIQKKKIKSKTSVVFYSFGIWVYFYFFLNNFLAESSIIDIKLM